MRLFLLALSFSPSFAETATAARRSLEPGIRR
jgi:hypothetical protein